MEDVVIVSACRTAIGVFGGALKDSSAVDMAAETMKQAVNRAGLDPMLIDDIRYGCCFEPIDAKNIARVAAIMAGLPDSIPAVTVNRVCISGMEAVVSGMAMIQAEMADVVLAGGVEHMSGIAYAVPMARWGCRLQDQAFVDPLIHGLYCGSHLIPHPENGPVDETAEPLSHFIGEPYTMGHTAEFVAQHFNISRQEMDAVALRSHHRAEKATLEGLFEEEIVPLEINQKKKTVVFDTDEHFREGLTIEQLQKLPPAFVSETGKVTVGNSSGINDGAAGLIIMSATKAKDLGLRPLARIRDVGSGACHPSVMGLSPVPAINTLMKKSGLKISDFELVEINEAFAAQYIACERELNLDPEITNINGSGIGLGHPVGATGARIIVTLIHAMKKRNKSLGLASLCGGGGVSLACAIEIV
ncbi:MAG: thiolase family protein [Planctomycetota bacterium]|jgi:acetyl-CoA C-acetyltransferase